MAGATTDLPEKLDPDAGIDLQVLHRPGWLRASAWPRWRARASSGSSGWSVLPDESGRERMIAYFHRRRGLGAVLEEGFVAYNDDKDQFEKLKDVPVGPALFPTGYPSRVQDRGGRVRLLHGPVPGPAGPGRLEELPGPRLLRGLHLPDARHALRRQGQGPARPRRRRQARVGVEEGYAAAGPQGAAGTDRGRQDDDARSRPSGSRTPTAASRSCSTTARASGTTTARSTS